jgi:hypothetical protein
VLGCRRFKNKKGKQKAKQRQSIGEDHVEVDEEDAQKDDRHDQQ